MKLEEDDSEQGDRAVRLRKADPGERCKQRGCKAPAAFWSALFCAAHGRDYVKRLCAGKGLQK